MTTETTHSPFDFAIGVGALTAQVAGLVLVPDDDAYPDETATWNLALPQHPRIVVSATSDLDVVAAVRFAGAYHLPVAVIATGHGAVRSAEGAMLINTSRMNGVQVDAQARTVRIEAGAQWQDVVNETARFGLAPVAGSAPDVGAVAYTLGGGLSPTMGRAHGFAADHVRALDVVTADGRLRHVDAEHDSDLFWALRGGKGNFGVVTAIETDLFEVSRLFGGGMFFAAEDARAVVEAYRRMAAHAPEELSSSFAFLRMPDAPMVPEPLRGRFVLHVRIAYLGAPEAGDVLVWGLRASALPIIDTVAEMPFSAFAAIHADPAGPLPVRETSALLRDLPDDAVDTLFAVAGPDADFPVTLVEIRHLGGALARRPHPDNAVGNRDAGFTLFTGAVTSPETAAHSDSVQAGLLEAMKPWSTGGTFLNFLGAGDGSPERVRTAYDPGVFERLAQIKAVVDPDNMFRINHNIPPAP